MFSPRFADVTRARGLPRVADQWRHRVLYVSEVVSTCYWPTCTWMNWNMVKQATYVKYPRGGTRVSGSHNVKLNQPIKVWGLTASRKEEKGWRKNSFLNSELQHSPSWDNLWPEATTAKGFYQTASPSSSRQSPDASTVYADSDTKI